MLNNTLNYIKQYIKLYHWKYGKLSTNDSITTYISALFDTAIYLALLWTILIDFIWSKNIMKLWEKVYINKYI